MEATKANADRMARALVQHVNAVLLSQTHAAIMREKIDAIDRECMDHLAPIDQYDGTEITDPRKLWHMDDASAKMYYAFKHDMLKTRGYTVSEVGECPALVAENLLRLAQRNLVDGATEFFPTMTADKLICAGLPKYFEYIRLIIGLVTNHPNYRKPELTAA